MQDKNETYSQFSTRLMSIFEYYLDSRKIGQSYNKLTDLMVHDGIKSCLSPALSCHILSLEANHKEGRIGRQGLAEALDSYLAIYRRVLVGPVLFLCHSPGQKLRQEMEKKESQPGNIVMIVTVAGVAAYIYRQLEACTCT